MAKKKEETVEVQAEVKQDISPLSAQFGQEDLNKVVEKINEIIARINA